MYGYSGQKKRRMVVLDLACVWNKIDGFWIRYGQKRRKFMKKHEITSFSLLNRGEIRDGFPLSLLLRLIYYLDLTKGPKAHAAYRVCTPKCSNSVRSNGQNVTDVLYNTASTAHTRSYVLGDDHLVVVSTVQIELGVEARDKGHLLRHRR